MSETAWIKNKTGGKGISRPKRKVGMLQQVGELRSPSELLSHFKEFCKKK